MIGRYRPAILQNGSYQNGLLLVEILHCGMRRRVHTQPAFLQNPPFDRIYTLGSSRFPQGARY